MERAPDIDRDFATFCRTADPEALGRVFDATAGHLLRIAAWLCGNRADAEDAVQRAFLVAIEQRAGFRRGQPALPWLVGLLTNQVHKVRRERARRAPPAVPPAGETDPAVRAASAELEQALSDVVQSLGASYRDVLHLHLREGLAAHEIAQRLGRPAGTVRTQIVRGVHELRRRLPAGFTGAFAPAWLANGTIEPAAAVRDAVLAAAKAQHALVATAVTTARTGSLLGALAASLAIGAGLVWLWPGPTAVDPAQHVAAAGERSDRATAHDRAASRDEAAAAPTGAAPENAPAEPLAREAVAAAVPAADAALRVLVRDGAALSLPEARVWLCDSTWREGSTRQGAAFQRALTSEGGVATFAAPAPELDTVVVLANGRRPVQAVRTVVSGEQLVVVDQQPSISGVVIVDGARPGEPIELTAHAGQPEEAWCDAARAAMVPFEPDEAAASAITDANGRFAFHGLAAGTEYSISPLVRAFKRPGTRRTEPAVKATPLATGVVLELARVPAIRGRPVLPQGLPRDGREQVWIRPRFVRTDGWTEWGGTMCRIGEQFTIGVFDTDLTATCLDFRFGRGKGSPVVATREVVCPFDGIHDLGDVVLDDPRSQREVRIVDRAGAAIAGARVMSLDLASELTGADGTVRVAIGPLPATIAAGAPGHRVRSIDVTEASPEPLVVVLEPANRLRIEVRGAAGAPPPAPLWLSLAFADLPSDHDFGDRKVVSALRGAKLLMTTFSADGSGAYVLDVPASGELELCDLPPKIGFTVKLCDGFGHPIESRPMTIGADERRDLQFVVAQRPRRIDGQVVDASGHALPGVDVHVGDLFDPLRTDPDGRFQVSGVYGDPPRLRFDKDGFQQLSVSGAELFDRTTYRLERAQ